MIETAKQTLIEDIDTVLRNDWLDSKYNGHDTSFDSYKFKDYNVIFEIEKTEQYYVVETRKYSILEKEGKLYLNIGKLKGCLNPVFAFSEKEIKELTTLKIIDKCLSEKYTYLIAKFLKNYLI